MKNNECDWMHGVFENKVIFKILLEFLDDSNKDLANCRLINKALKDKFTLSIQRKFLEKRVFVYFRKDATMQKYLSTIPSYSKNQFFSCFNLEREWTPRYYYHDHVLNKFLESLEQRINSLSLGVQHTSPQPLVNILKSQTTSLTELKIVIGHRKRKFQNHLENDINEDFKLHKLNYLCFSLLPEIFADDRKNQPFEVDPHYQYIPPIMELVLSKIPPERQIKLCLIKWELISSTFSVLQKYNQVKNLKVVQLSETCNSFRWTNPMELMADAGVKLQFFSFEPVKYPPIQLDITRRVHKFLCTQTSNLEYLCWGSHCSFKFPDQMPVLRKLLLRYQGHIWEGEDEDSDVEAGRFQNCIRATIRCHKEWVRSCPPIDYQQIFPQLEELKLRSNLHLTEPKFVSWFLPPQLPCTSVKKLAVNYARTNADIVKSISDIFPLLTSLVLEHWMGSFSLCLIENRAQTKKFYRTLFNSDFASTLQTFALYSVPGRNLISENWEWEWDSSFSGLPEDRILELSKSLPFPDEVQDEINLGAGSILNFKNLKVLLLNSRILNHTQNLTDFSAFCLFGKMKNLEFFHASRANRKFSKPALEYLRSKPARNLKSFLTDDADPIDQVFGTSYCSYEVQVSQFLVSQVKNIMNLLDPKSPECECRSCYPLPTDV